MKDILIGAAKRAHSSRPLGHDWSKQARVSRFDRIEDLLSGRSADETNGSAGQVHRPSTDAKP